jgi:hypothetical protein
MIENMDLFSGIHRTSNSQNIYNDSLFSLFEQNYQNNSSFNENDENFYDLNEFFLTRKNNSISNESKDIEKCINTIKGKEGKDEDKTIINNNNYDNNNMTGKKKPRKHDKTAKDNIKRKIQVNYIKFLKNLLNQISIELLCNYENNENIQFFPLNYDFIKLISKEYFNSLKKQTLGDIFKNNVSHKFKNYQILNIKVYNEITDKSETIKKILDTTYLEFFDVYYLNKKTLNLSKYGLDKTIILSSDIRFFKDLLKKDNSDSESSSEDDIYYQNRIKECIKKYFMRNDKPIFFIE